MSEDKSILAPSEIDFKLRCGIFRLLQAKFTPVLGSESKFLTAAVFNWFFAEPPGNEQAEKFLKFNEDQIIQKARTLHLDSDLGLALSVLYTFTLLQLGPTNPEKSMALLNRASESNIFILSPDELYPGADAIKFLAFLDEYATRLLTL